MLLFFASTGVFILRDARPGADDEWLGWIFLMTLLLEL